MDDNTVPGAGQIPGSDMLLKLFRVVQRIPVMMIVADADGIVEYVNPRFTEITGYTAAEVVGTNIWELQCSNVNQEVCHQLKDIVLRQEEWHGQMPNWKKSGELYWESVSISAIRDTGVVTDIVILKEDITEQKRVEEKLFESEERFKAFMDNSPTIAWMKDKGGRYVYTSRTYGDRFGIPVQDWQGKTDFEIWPEETAQMLAENDHRVVLTNQLLVSVEEVPAPNGRKWWWNFRFPFRDAIGKMHIGGIGIDITDQRETEEALRVAQETAAREAVQLRAVLDQMTEGLVIFDSQGELLEMNPAALRIHGLGEQDSPRASLVALQSVYDLFDLQGNQLPLHEWPISRVLRGETFHSYDVRVRRRDTGKMWIASYGGAPVKERDGTVIRCIVTMRDITVRMEMEAAVRESEERYRMLFVSMTEGFAIGEAEFQPDLTPCDFRFVDINPAFERHTGLTRDIVGKSIRSVLPDLESQWVENYCHVAATGEPIKFESYNADTGRYFDVYAYSPSPGRFAAIVSDISERKRSEEERERLFSEVQRSNQELQQFAYVASHDLQEPLRMVANYMYLLERRYKENLDDKGLSYLNYAVDGAKRMQRLIEGLLNYSRISRGVELLPTDANAAYAAAVSNLNQIIQETGGTVTADSLPMVQGDESQLIQLFQNLIGNGLKYHRPGEPPVVHVSARPEGMEWIFTVSDNGIGIDPQYFDRIFQIFQRLHTRDEYPGTGIGLASCKKIVERHGGRIWVESAAGAGSTFFFTLRAER